MSIRHGAWVSGVPSCLTIEYPPHPECLYTPVGGKRAASQQKANFRRNLDFPMKRPFFAK